MPYRLTPRMLQDLRNSLGTYHGLFNGGRCQAWELEELITRAINSDTRTQHHARWNEGGHDDHEDIQVRINGRTIGIQIKSGQVKPRNETLTISGHRLTRFNGDFEAISDYLNSRDVDIISVSYNKIDNDQGRQHEYTVRYIEIDRLCGVFPERWQEHGQQFIQENDYGILFSLRPSMSWQVWWEIPLNQAEEADRFIA